MYKALKLFERKEECSERKEDHRKRAALKAKVVNYLKHHGRYRYKSKLGNGSFGEVLLMKTPNKTLIAVKVMPTEYTCEGELTLWPYLDHPNVLPLLEVKQLEDMDIFLMPYHPSTLDWYLRSKRFHRSPGSIDQVKVWLRGIACGLEYLHRSNICHCDMKLNNILISAQMTAVICDFSCISVSTGLIERYALPQCFCPPEACQSLGRPPICGKALDVWAFGIMVFNICSNNLTKYVQSSDNWKKDVYPVLFKALQTSTFRRILTMTFPSASEEDSCDALNLIQGILRLDPEDRPSISLVLGHSFLNISRNEENMLLVPDLIWSVRKRIIFENLLNESYTNDAFQESENKEQNSNKIGGKFLKRAGDFYVNVVKRPDDRACSAPMNTDESIYETTSFPVLKALKCVETKEKSMAVQEGNNEEQNFDQPGEKLFQLAGGDVCADVVKHTDVHACISAPVIVNRDNSFHARTSFSVPKDFNYVETEQNSSAVQGLRIPEQDSDQIEKKFCQLTDEKFCTDVVKRADVKASISVPVIVNIDESSQARTSLSVPKSWRFAEMKQKSELKSSIEEPKNEQAASRKGLRSWIAKKFRVIRSLKCNCFK